MHSRGADRLLFLLIDQVTSESFGRAGGRKTACDCWLMHEPVCQNGASQNYGPLHSSPESYSALFSVAKPSAVYTVLE